jgi:hypothetical protein
VSRRVVRLTPEFFVLLDEQLPVRGQVLAVDGTVELVDIDIDIDIDLTPPMSDEE